MRLPQRSKKSPIARPGEFQQLYEQHRFAVFRYIYSLTGGPHEYAEDLTADTFLRAWKARRDFTGEPAKAIGWLIRIAKRLVIDQYRRDRAYTRLSAEHHAEEIPSAEQQIIAAEQSRHLLALLAELPQEAREMLTLRYMLGWRVGDIALHLGVSENSVSVTIHRSLARLQEKWNAVEKAEIAVEFVAEENV